MIISRILLVPLLYLTVYMHLDLTLKPTRHTKRRRSSKHPFK